MRLDETKTMHPGEWIAFRSTDESDNPEGELILHNKDRRAFDKELVRKGITNVYITFAGPAIPEGYGTLF
jgi:hypothetical protein